MPGSGAAAASPLYYEAVRRGPDPEGLAISALVNALRLDPDTAAEASRWMSGGGSSVEKGPLVRSL
ncbi:MAG: hypothetical protein ACP5I3_07615 [Thermoproteus sp.]